MEKEEVGEERRSTSEESEGDEAARIEEERVLIERHARVRVHCVCMRGFGEN